MTQMISPRHGNAQTDLKALAARITLQCDNVGVVYDISQLPTKIGPDCYMIQGTRLSNECKSQGKCLVERFYALTGGQTISIVDKNQEPVVL